MNKKVVWFVGKFQELKKSWDRRSLITKFEFILAISGVISLFLFVISLLGVPVLLAQFSSFYFLDDTAPEVYSVFPPTGWMDLHLPSKITAQVFDSGGSGIDCNKSVFLIKARSNSISGSIFCNSTSLSFEPVSDFGPGLYTYSLDLFDAAGNGLSRSFDGSFVILSSPEMDVKFFNSTAPLLSTLNESSEQVFVVLLSNSLTSGVALTSLNYQFDFPYAISRFNLDELDQSGLCSASLSMTPRFYIDSTSIPVASQSLVIRCYNLPPGSGVSLHAYLNSNFSGLIYGCRSCLNYSGIYYWEAAGITLNRSESG